MFLPDSHCIHCIFLLLNILLHLLKVCCYYSLLMVLNHSFLLIALLACMKGLTLWLIVQISFLILAVPFNFIIVSQFYCWFGCELSRFRCRYILRFLQLVCFRNVDTLLLLSLFRSVLLHPLCTDFLRLKVLFLYLFLCRFQC
jgi:hypothetical protein